MGIFKKARCPTEAELVSAKQAAIVAKKDHRAALDAYYASSDTKDSPEAIVRMQIEEMRKRKISDAAEAAFDRLWMLYKKANGAD